jgi:hypothetical protein
MCSCLHPTADLSRDQVLWPLTCKADFDLGFYDATQTVFDAIPCHYTRQPLVIRHPRRTVNISLAIFIKKGIVYRALVSHVIRRHSFSDEIRHYCFYLEGGNLLEINCKILAKNVVTECWKTSDGHGRGEIVSLVYLQLRVKQAMSRIESLLCVWKH